MPIANGRMAPVLVMIALFLGISAAALSAPPAAFAADEPAPAPVPSPTPPPAPTVPDPPADAVRVGIGRDLTSAAVSAPGGLYVVGNGAILGTIQPGQAASLTLDGGQVAVAGVTGKAASLRLVPVPPAQAAPAPAPGTVPPAPANPVTYGGKPYRGEMTAAAVTTDGQHYKLYVINVVSLEEYLMGVVPCEMGSDWPGEALKAQAVAARSYVVRNLGKRDAYGYDVDDGTSDQVYGGLKAEAAASSQAVVATAGQVVKYGTQIATAMYHASSGGHTENNEIIYQSVPVSYLRGVEDYDNVPGNKYYTWDRTFTADQFAQKLKAYGYDPGAVAGVSAGGAIGVSGRPSRWSVSGSIGALSIPAQTFRSALGLPSAPRSATVQAGATAPGTKVYTAAQTVAVMGADGQVTQRVVSGTAVVGAFGMTAAPGDQLVATNGALVQTAGNIVISGGGNGHAVGMSQWGAFGMAQQSKTYIDILTHYYTGTTVQKR